MLRWPGQRQPCPVHNPQEWSTTRPQYARQPWNSDGLIAGKLVLKADPQRFTCGPRIQHYAVGQCESGSGFWSGSRFRIPVPGSGFRFQVPDSGSRFRIPDRVPYPGFRGPKIILKSFSAGKKSIFFYQKLQLLIIRPSKKTSKLPNGKHCECALKSEHPALFSICVGHFCPPGSGSSRQKTMQIQADADPYPDQDPQHWIIL